jgi:hypothetical protein
MFSTLVLLALTLNSSPAMRPALSGAAPDELAARLRVRIPKYDLSAESYIDALTRAASQFRIPMGIEWVDTPAAREKLSLSWKNATVKEILWAIAHSRRGYVAEIKNGVVHVYPSRLIPDKQNFLRLKIGHFEAIQQVVQMASRNLDERVKLTVSPPKPRHGGGGVMGSLGVNPDDPELTVRLNNASVEEVLDALAVASNRKIWIVTFSRDPTLTPTGFRRTLSLWTTSPVPDNEQPVWDLLHWGDQLPSPAPRPN